MRSCLASEAAKHHLQVHEESPVLGAMFEGKRCRVEHTGGLTAPANHVWLATGTTPNLGAMPYLAHLLPDVVTVGGYPLLSQDLRLGPHPVHLMGRLTTIELGPAAGNLWGAQTAARRITRSITGVDLGPSLSQATPPASAAYYGKEDN